MNKILGQIKVKDFLFRGEHWYNVIGIEGNWYVVDQKYNDEFAVINKGNVLETMMSKFNDNRKFNKTRGDL